MACTSFSWSKGWKENTSWKPRVLVKREETVKVPMDGRPKKAKKSVGGKRRVKSIPPSRTAHQRKESFVQKSNKESPKREEDLLTQVEELKCQNKVDTMTRIDLADNFRELKKRSEVILAQKRLQKENSGRFSDSTRNLGSPRIEKLKPWVTSLGS